MFLKKLFYKKKYIIYFLSAILTLMISNNNVKALYVNNYGVEANLPDFTEYTNYSISYGSFNFSNTIYNDVFILLAYPNNWSNRAFYVNTRSNLITSSNLYGVLAFNSNGGPSACNCNFYYYIYDSVNNVWSYKGTHGGPSVVGNNFFQVYNYKNLQYTFSPNTIYYSAGYTIEPEITYPSWSINNDVMKYDSDNSLFNELDLVVSDKDLDTYIYDIRVQSFDGSSWLTDWSSVDWYYNSTHTHLISYTNLRYWLRIRDKSSLDVVYDSPFVVSSFYNSNYKEYFLNDTDVYYYVSGFTNESSNVVIAPKVPFRWSDVVYYDFTSGLIVKDNYNIIYPTFDHCSINDISYDVCISVDFSTDIPSFDSTHTYGLRIQNNFGPTALFNNSPFSYNDTSFLALNSLYVSSGGIFNPTSNSFIDNDYDYSDSSGNIISSSGLDTFLSDYDSLSFALNESSAHFSNFFSFISLGFSNFFTSLSSPLAFAWIFCFSIVIVAICIKFFF